MMFMNTMQLNANNVMKFWRKVIDLGRCILLQIWAYITLWGQKIDTHTHHTHPRRETTEIIQQCSMEERLQHGPHICI